MPYLLKKHYPLRDIIFCAGEGLLIFLAFCFTHALLIGDYLYSFYLTLHLTQAFVVTITFQLCLYFYDLYDLNRNITIIDTVSRMTQAFGLGCIVLAVVYYTMPLLSTAIRIFWPAYFAICGVVLLWRWAYYFILQKRLFLHRVCIIGTGSFASEIAREIEGRNDSAYRIVCFSGDSEVSFNPNKIPVRKVMSDMVQYCQQNDIETIILALDNRRNATPSKRLLACKLSGIRVQQGTDFYEKITGRIPVSRVNPSGIFLSDGFTVGRWTGMTKRVVDIAFSLLGLLVSLPLTLLSAIIIKLESKGPVIYVQERVGQQGAVFNILKFRSMYQNSEKDGAVWATKNDPRVTRFGQFIRSVRIDEIPQMVNVLKGDMSFVGPRPERPFFVEKLAEDIPFYNIRHCIKPGITGWAQVCYPYGASVADSLRKLEYDLYYMKNISAVMDILIIFKTIKTVLFKIGSR
jgi:sugar transferase (PEP-CTERM system associated)